MRFRALLKLILALAAVLSGSSSTSLALAHAVSHAREAHERSDHHHVPTGRENREHGPAFHPADSHGHPVLQIATAQRIDQDLIGPASPAVAAVGLVIFPNQGPLPQAGTDAVDRATGPPPQTRAPPLL